MVDTSALDTWIQSIEDILVHAFHTQHPISSPHDHPQHVETIACLLSMHDQLGLSGTRPPSTYVSYQSCLQCQHCIEHMQLLSGLLAKLYRYYARSKPSDTQKQALLCTCLRALERVGGGIPQLQLVCYCIFAEHGLAAQYLLLSDKLMISPPVLLSLIGRVENDILCILVMNQLHHPAGCNSLQNARTLTKIASLCLTREEDVLQFASKMVPRMSLFHNDPTILYHLCIMLFTHPNHILAKQIVQQCRKAISSVSMHTLLSVQDALLQYGYATMCTYPDTTTVPDFVWDHLCFLHTFLVNHPPETTPSAQVSQVLYTQQQEQIAQFWSSKWIHASKAKSWEQGTCPVFAILEHVLGLVLHTCRPAYLSQIIHTTHTQSPLLHVDLLHWSDIVLYSIGSADDQGTQPCHTTHVCHKEVLTYLSTAPSDTCMEGWQALRLAGRAMSVLLGWVYASCPLFSPHVAEIHVVGRTVQVQDQLAQFLLTPKENSHLDLSSIQFATLEDCLEILSRVQTLSIPLLHDALQKTLCSCIDDKTVDTLIERAQASASHFLHHMCVRWCHHHPRPFGCNVYTLAMVRFFEDQAYDTLWVRSNSEAFFQKTMEEDDLHAQSDSVRFLPDYREGDNL